MLLPGTRRNLFTTAYDELKEILGDCEPAPVEQKELMERLISTMKEKSRKASEEGMWQVIEKVWVEMLCFSASRCRGYLHAKPLGTGGEFLSAPHVIHGDGELDRPAAQGGASNSKLPLLGREQQHRSIDDF
nr:unnamed protein product [Digitaria exilis]